MDRNPLAQFILIAVAGVLAATLISWEGGRAPRLRHAESAWRAGAMRVHGQFTGADDDGHSLVWELASPEAGALRLRLHPVREPIATGGLRWTVAARLEAREAGDGPSLEAELSGEVDWVAGTLRLEGPVRRGRSDGDVVRFEARVVECELDGVITVARGLRIAAHANAP